MCLGIPGKVVSLEEGAVGVPMGKVSFGGITKDVCFAYVPEVQIGDYVIVHVGFALNKIDEEEAKEIVNLIKTIERDTEF